jgi:hypothetical protein
MPRPTFLQQVFARDPRRIARLPDAPVDRAMEEWRRSQTPAAPGPVAAPAAAPATALADSTPAEGFGAAIGNLATHVWRAKNKMVDAKTGLPHEETKRAYRHVEAAIEALQQLEVTMQDWLHQSYDAGLPVKVLTFQPTPGLTRDTVVEVIRPAVIWKNQLLQLGEVVVGIPETSPPPAALSS